MVSTKKKELKRDIALAKINAAYHQKQMEYYKLEVIQLEELLNDLL